MEIVSLDANGEISSKTLLRYGGSISFIQAVKLGGIGSPKIIYLDGIESFDTLKTLNENEILFANFEILNHGLLLRVNKTQRLMACIFHMDELDRISLTGYRIQLKYRDFFKRIVTKIVLKGTLEIIYETDKVVQFEIPVSSFPSSLKFFQKTFFQSKFHYQISPDPPVVDDTQLWINNIFGNWQ